MTPYYFQTLAVNSIFDYYFKEGKNGNPLVCMPCATGKSVVIADFIQQVFRHFPNQRVMMLTHVWKLIEQNADKIRKFWPTVPLGIHSAGLDLRDTIMPIIYGGVQSVVKNVVAFGHIDLLLIDEAHLVNMEEDTQYHIVISELRKINPFLKVIGFTATDYRMKLGKLTEGGLFTDVCFDITTHEWFQRLIAEGYLTPLIGKPTNTKIVGLETVGSIGGEFNQKQAELLVDKEEITYSAVKELLEYGGDRNKCMIFAAGVNNAEHIASMFQSFGVTATAVHSKISDKENKRRLEAYSAGEYWAVVGANMLTTGYDEPAIDLIGDFQLTKSTPKHVQKLGRGTRKHPRKINTLYMDFVGNVMRCGPIDDPVMPRKPGAATGDVPIKICETIKLSANKERFEEMRQRGEKINLSDPSLVKGCDAYNHASARNCCNCAAEFNFDNKVQASAFYDSPMKQDDAPILETIVLKKPVLYTKNSGKEKLSGIISPPTAKVTYFAGLKPINVFLCFEHTGKARHMANEWWRRHSANEPPKTVDEFLSRTNELRVPKSILVHISTRYPSVEQYEF